MIHLRLPKAVFSFFFFFLVLAHFHVHFITLISQSHTACYRMPEFNHRVIRLHYHVRRAAMCSQIQPGRLIASLYRQIVFWE